MPNPTAAMIVIGDEILSGRTRDSNMNYLAVQLNTVGIDLKEARMIADDHDTIVNTVNDLRKQVDYVCTSGGIGPTHDDITADCIAAAFGVSIDIRDDARELLQAHYDRNGQELNTARLRMARIPDGAELIENPVSIAPGFHIENVYVMAGVPKVFQAMVASVLPKLIGGNPLISESQMINRGEGDIAQPLASLAKEFDDLSIGSYPFNRQGIYGTNIVIRGTDANRVGTAMQKLKAIFPE